MGFTIKMQWEFSPFGSQTKIPVILFKFPSQSSNVAIGYELANIKNHILVLIADQ